MIQEQEHMAERAIRGMGANGALVCSGNFEKQWGLPCWHKVLRKKQTGETIQITDISRHWWLRAHAPDDDEDRVRRIEDPLII